MPSYTLTQLTSAIRICLEKGFPGRYWVTAETSGVRVGSSGHCYLEFIDKDISDSQITARIKSMMWASDYKILSERFRQETGQTFDSGLQVLILVSISYHEQFGLSLRILDIDSTYTLGALARKRKEIIEELKKAGLYDLNKSLIPSRPIQRIAVISSGKAAGYEDFIAHLKNSTEKFCFYPTLFQAVMQGNQTESSVLKALSLIEHNQAYFDIVVIIRGGGAVSELAAFDSFAIGKACAQFPLPIITGIGHDRDETIVDLVAYKSLKTPTAVADFLVDIQRNEWNLINDFQNRTIEALRVLMLYNHERLMQVSLRTPSILKASTREEHQHIKSISDRIHLSSKHHITYNIQQLQLIGLNLPRLIKSSIKDNKGNLEKLSAQLPLLTREKMRSYDNCLKSNEQAIRLLHPNTTLQRGFAIILKGGKAVRSKSELKEGEHLTSQFADGSIGMIVVNTEQGK